MHTESLIDFFCVICGQSLTAPPEFAGNVIGCPSCGRAVPVPGYLEDKNPEGSWKTAFDSNILSVDLRFVCPGCSSALIADARSSGDPYVCPRCEAAGRVPGWITPGAPPSTAHLPAVVHTAALSTAEIAFLSGESDRAWAGATPAG